MLRAQRLPISPKLCGHPTFAGLWPDQSFNLLPVQLNHPSTLCIPGTVSIVRTPDLRRGDVDGQNHEAFPPSDSGGAIFGGGHDLGESGQCLLVKYALSFSTLEEAYFSHAITAHAWLVVCQCSRVIPLFRNTCQVAQGFPQSRVCPSTVRD